MGRRTPKRCKGDCTEGCCNGCSVTFCRDQLFNVKTATIFSSLPRAVFNLNEEGKESFSPPKKYTHTNRFYSERTFNNEFRSTLLSRPGPTGSIGTVTNLRFTRNGKQGAAPVISGDYVYSVSSAGIDLSILYDRRIPGDPAPSDIETDMFFTNDRLFTENPLVRVGTTSAVVRVTRLWEFTVFYSPFGTAEQRTAYKDGQQYLCIKAHTSSAASTPGTAEGREFWSELTFGFLSQGVVGQYKSDQYFRGSCNGTNQIEMSSVYFQTEFVESSISTGPYPDKSAIDSAYLLQLETVTLFSGNLDCCDATLTRCSCNTPQPSGDSYVDSNRKFQSSVAVTVSNAVAYDGVPASCFNGTFTFPCTVFLDGTVGGLEAKGYIVEEYIDSSGRKIIYSVGLSRSNRLGNTVYLSFYIARSIESSFSFTGFLTDTAIVEFPLLPGVDFPVGIYSCIQDVVPASGVLDFKDYLAPELVPPPSPFVGCHSGNLFFFDSIEASYAII